MERGGGIEGASKKMRIEEVTAGAASQDLSRKHKYCNCCCKYYVFPSDIASVACPCCSTALNEHAAAADLANQHPTNQEKKPNNSKAAAGKRKTEIHMDNTIQQQQWSYRGFCKNLPSMFDSGNNNSASKNSASSSSAGNNGRKSHLLIAVPDADIHDFEGEKRAEDFTQGQIWALFQESSGLPRLYARIDAVSASCCAETGFGAKVTWLDCAEKNAGNWVHAGFHPVCGDFVASNNTSTFTSGDVFCHQVSWRRTQDQDQGRYRIVPRKSEVWALYRGWSSSWAKEAAAAAKSVHEKGNYHHHEQDQEQGLGLGFEVVEIMSDFVDDVGVVVSPLAKAEGFRTLHRSQAENMLTLIPWYEVFRFSHQIPRQIVYDLDPAAILHLSFSHNQS